MGRSGGFAIKFDKDFLISLKEDPSSGVEVESCRHHLALHPFQLNNIENSIQNELKRKIAKYDKHFKGLLLGYQNIKLLDNLGAIEYDMCFIHISITADFFVFKPEIGKELKGIVTKISKDHVGCLVYNMFNVSLPEFENTDDDWLGDKVKVGCEVLFEITFMDLEINLPYIRGKLISILTEDKGSKKKRKTELNKKIKVELQLDVEDVPVAKEEKKRKSRNKQFIKEEGRIQESQDREVGSENERTFKKKKKHKLNKGYDLQSDNFEDTEKEEKKKSKKRDKRKEKTEVSLGDLNLSRLFNSDETANSLQESDGSQNRPSRKHNRSVSRKMSVDNIKKELPFEYDLDYTVDNIKKELSTEHEEKDYSSTTKKSKKRKRNEIENGELSIENISYDSEIGSKKKRKHSFSESDISRKKKHKKHKLDFSNC